jgi:hypothetical protein
MAQQSSSYVAEGELCFLRMHARDPILTAFNIVYKHAESQIEAQLKQQQAEAAASNRVFAPKTPTEFSNSVMKLFEENLETIVTGAWSEFVIGHCMVLLQQHPRLERFPQEIGWAYMRTRYASKNNAAEFKEHQHQLPFKNWYLATFDSAARKFMDNPGLFDQSATMYEMMMNLNKSKAVIDQAILEGIYGCLNWERAFACPNGRPPTSGPSGPSGPSTTTAAASQVRYPSAILSPLHPAASTAATATAPSATYSGFRTTPAYAAAPPAAAAAATLSAAAVDQIKESIRREFEQKQMEIAAAAATASNTRLHQMASMMEAKVREMQQDIVQRDQRNELLTREMDAVRQTVQELKQKPLPAAPIPMPMSSTSMGLFDGDINYDSFMKQHPTLNTMGASGGSLARSSPSPSPMPPPPTVSTTGQVRPNLTVVTSDDATPTVEEDGENSEARNLKRQILPSLRQA